MEGPRVLLNHYMVFCFRGVMSSFPDDLVERPVPLAFSLLILPVHPARMSTCLFAARVKPRSLRAWAW